MVRHPGSVTTPLSTRMGLGTHELVAIVGAGGKTTILLTLGRELGASGRKVILTTTTRMAPDQITDPVCWSDDIVEVGAAIATGTPLFVLSGQTDHTIIGLAPRSVDRLFATTPVDHVLVEADGARTMSIKAPDDHEPAIPRTATTVIVVMGADALGQPVGTVAHRVDRITALTGLTENELITPESAASILLDPEGGLKSIPDAARVVMAVTKVTPRNRSSVAELAVMLKDHPGVERCVEIPQPPG